MKYKAVFTEYRKDIYLELWLKYYSKFFKDIYVVNTDPLVLDKNLNQLSKKYKFTILDNYINEEWSMEVSRLSMMEVQSNLLKEYMWVLFAHCDEFVVPDPEKYRNLNDYIKQCKKDYVFCNGYDVLHMYEEADKVPNEPELDLNKPILPQRKYWLPTLSYCKPLLSKIPLVWTQGFHNIHNVSDEVILTHVDKDLRLLHLKNADYNIFGKRLLSSSGIGKDKDYDWFYKEHNKKEIIPERFKKSL
jgi:hypothetical protein